MSSRDCGDDRAALFSRESVPGYDSSRAAAGSSRASASGTASGTASGITSGITSGTAGGTAGHGRGDTPPGTSGSTPADGSAAARAGGSARGDAASGAADDVASSAAEDVASAAATAAAAPLARAGCISDGDVLALLDRLQVAGTHDDPDAQDAVLAAEIAALGDVDDGPAASAAWIGECLPAGPGLAAVLAAEPPATASDWDLPGLAAGYRRVAAWAQARELAAAAEIAARCAAANPTISTSEDGQPGRLPPEAAAQLALELRMSQTGAADWMTLGSQLRWRLPATGAALAAGHLDVPRARIIAEGTAALDDEHAAAVEHAILAAAAGQTTGQLRATVRRAVLAADPEGAEERRRGAERRARLTLYPEPDGTASLNGTSLPGIHAAAAMARITAMARALKSSGAHGGLDLLRAQIFLGLLLGTLPLIPPPPGAPPDQPPPDDWPAPQPPPGDGPATAAGQPADGDGPGSAAHAEPTPGDGTGAAGPGDQAQPPPGSSRVPSDQPPAGSCGTNRAQQDPNQCPPGSDHDEDPNQCPPGSDDDELPGPWTDIPCPDDSQAPRPGDDPPAPPPPPPRAGHDFEDDQDDGWPAPDWPPLPALVPAGPVTGRTKVSAARPRAGLLDFTVPWTALVGRTGTPGQLSRAGWLTSLQTRQLLVAAALSPMTSWHVVLTDPSGRALDSQRLPAWPPGQQLGKNAVIGRVTVAIPLAALPPQQPSHAQPAPDPQPAPQPGLPAGTPLILRTIAGPLLHAATSAAARYLTTHAASAGGCAHTLASDNYRPPPRLRDAVAIHDRTCRFTTCGQPAWRTDLDHTLAWHKGGRTCTCGLGGCCRLHHRIKQLPGWKLQQPTPGTFRWTTPAGRSYTTRPDPYPI